MLQVMTVPSFTLHVNEVRVGEVLNDTHGSRMLKQSSIHTHRDKRHDHLLLWHEDVFISPALKTRGGLAADAVRHMHLAGIQVKADCITVVVCVGQGRSRRGNAGTAPHKEQAHGRVRTRKGPRDATASQGVKRSAAAAELAEETGTGTTRAKKKARQVPSLLRICLTPLSVCVCV